MGLGVVVVVAAVVVGLGVTVVVVEICVVVGTGVVLVVVVFITTVISIFILRRKVKQMSLCDTRSLIYFKIKIN